MLELREISKKNRLKAIQMYKKANAGHIGCSLSCIDLLVYFLYYKKSEQDLFILSKGHASVALYCVLNEKGIISDSMLGTFYEDGTIMAAHPPACGVPGVLFGTGSLGHGLSLSSGLALGAKLKNESQKAFCVMSDGECNEGSIWEAAAFASHHKLNNVVAIIDKNNIQGFGFTKDVIDMANLAQKWESFGWEVQECDGHDFLSIENAYENFVTDKPKCLIANTVKGKGVHFMENKMEWHYLPMTDEQYEMAIKDIESEK
jgi:transketolase